MRPTLEELRTHFTALGFGVSENAWFGHAGVLVFKKPEPTAAGEISVSEGWVCIYPVEDEWLVRVTPHGAQHWGRRATTLGEIEALTLEVVEVGQNRWTPSEGWSEVSDGPPN